VEAGTVRPKAQTVIQIANALAFPMGFFATSGRTAQNLTAERTFFRSLRKSRGIDREAAMAQAILLAELVSIIVRHAELPALTIPGLPVRPDASNEEIDAVAMTVRREWNLGDQPIHDVVLELERHGAVTARLALAEDVDAFSWPGLGRPIVILGSDKADRARSRFDAAHELAHLVMHRDDPRAGDRDLERQAHRFASAFLLPAGRLEAEWPRGRLNWLALIALKGRWQMSIAALLYRARADGVISETTYESAAKYLSRAGWRTREPGPLGPPESPRLVQEAIRLLREGGIEVERWLPRRGFRTTSSSCISKQRAATRVSKSCCNRRLGAHPTESTVL
jgi:Zn-dependent peptidase ImmA (M78 family)